MNCDLSIYVKYIQNFAFSLEQGTISMPWSKTSETYWMENVTNVLGCLITEGSLCDNEFF